MAVEKKRILLVEDEAIIAMMEKKELEKHDYYVEYATNGENAIQQALKSDSLFDLILMDIDLGSGIDGTQAAEKILKEKNIPIVFLSSHTEPEIVEKTEKITSYGYVVKNSSITVLDASIKMAFKLFDASIKEKEKEDALRKSEEMMRNSESLARICSYSTNLIVDDLDESAWTCSPEFYKIFGIDETYPHTIAGWARFIHPDYRERIVAYHEQVVRDRTLFDQEYKIVRISDGAERWVHGTGKLEFDVKGIPVRMHGAIQDITERKRSEEALEKSQRLYHDLVETSHDLIWQCDAQGRYIYLNPAWEQVLGYRIEEMIGQSFSEFQSLEQAQRDKELFGRLLQADGMVNGYETVHLKKDGTELHLVFNAKAYFDADGSISGTQGTAFDITEYKRMENAVRTSESLFKKVFEILPIGLWIADKNGNLMQGNPAGVKIWGKEPKIGPSNYGLFKAMRLPSREDIAPDDWALAHTINNGITIVDELLEIEAFDGKKKIILGAVVDKEMDYT
jgi:PAS domain S-box-containing protein